MIRIDPVEQQVEDSVCLFCRASAACILNLWLQATMEMQRPQEVASEQNYPVRKEARWTILS